MTLTRLRRLTAWATAMAVAGLLGALAARLDTLAAVARIAQEALK